MRQFGRRTQVQFAQTHHVAMDMALCTSVDDFFKFFFYLDRYGPMWSETGPESVRFGLERSETGPESVQYGLKFLLKKKKKHKILYQNTPFCQQSIKEKP